VISVETATDIALAWREIAAAEKLLAEIEDTLTRAPAPDVRDVFGRLQNGLQLGVPSGNNGHRLFNVPWSMCRPVIQAHIEQQRQIIAVLNAKALIEAKGEAK
jgi:hypothetical protein